MSGNSGGPGKLNGSRTMALDFGDKTIGVALSDPLGIIASGLETIRRSNPDDVKASLARLREIIKEYGVGEILLGYPKNMNNTDGPRCEKTMAFGKKLEREFKDVPVVLWDERLSTKSALVPLTGASPEKKKKLVDTLAAVYILQGYMDYKKKNYIKKYHHKNINEVKELDKDNDKDLNNDLNNEFDGAFDELGDEEEYEIITLLDDDDEEVNFAVLDAKDVNGVTYMLVLEEESLDDDEAEASILKGVMVDGEDEIVYEFVEDDKEFEFAAGLFDEGGEDFDIE